MQLNFQAVLAQLGPGAAFRIANGARPPADYLFATFLPEQLKPNYDAKSGSMTVRAVMAGLVGMDSPLPPSGLIDGSTFAERTVKLGLEIGLPEQVLRELQGFIAYLAGNQEAVSKEMTLTVLNFVDKLLVQPHLDTTEWLRGQALAKGAIDWTFGDKRLQVDYGVPAANLLTARTGNDGYGGSTSKFWTDMRSQRKLLKRVRARLAHPDTIEMILNNDVNKVRVLAQDEVTGTVTIGRLVGSTEQLSPDARDRITLIGYGAEAEVFDPTDSSKTKKVPFLATGKVVAIGEPITNAFVVGQGSTQSSQNTLPVGYTHVAPTVEGGTPGRWADVFIPEGQPWSIRGRSVSNVLPVIEAPEKISVATTDMV